uniref:Uncharacterized protein n=1 Tax=Anguilla anguilla TaxID=7936 RepID=A0A0E9PF55_ANGAN
MLNNKKLKDKVQESLTPQPVNTYFSENNYFGYFSVLNRLLALAM